MAHAPTYGGATVNKVMISQAIPAIGIGQTKVEKIIGHALELYADGSVWDPTLNRYLNGTREYSPADLHRS